MNTIRLYLRSMAMQIRCQLEYPVSFLLQTFAQFIMEGSEMLAVILIVDRFGRVNQWEAGDLFFFFGMMSVTFYLTEIFGRGITGNFPYLIRTGQMDTMLVRPRGVLTQVLCSAADPRRITCVGIGTVSLIIGSNLARIQWTWLKAAAMAEAIILGGVLILGLFLIEAIFVIYSVKSVELVNALTYGGRSACEYPVDIFPSPLRILFTAIAPFALVLHVPSGYILDKPLYNWPAWTAFVCPLAGIAFFLITYSFLRIALRHYRSTGS